MVVPVRGLSQRSLNRLGKGSMTDLLRGNDARSGDRWNSPPRLMDSSYSGERWGKIRHKLAM